MGALNLGSSCPGLDRRLTSLVHFATLDSFVIIVNFIFFLLLLGYPGDNNLAAQHKKSPFLRSKSKDKDKSPTAHPTLSKRLRFWSSSDIPSSPNEPVSFSDIGDF